MKTKLALVIVALPLLALVIVALPSAISAQTVTYTAASGEILNPERGFWIYCFMNDRTNYNWLRTRGYSICYANIDLSDFRETALSQAKLDELQRAFDRMRLAGVKGFIRITYDNTIAGIDTTLEWMETHLIQLQPLFADNMDMIAFFQAGMIGAWGEWHHSSNLHHLNPQPVWDLLLFYLPLERTIAVRTPSFVNMLEGLDINPLTSEEAFTGISRARIAHHNDCWLSNIRDTGTYHWTSVIREQEKEQIENHSRYIPWGGELCRVSSFSHCDNAVAEATRFHATHMNSGYNSDVIDILKDEGCWRTTFAEKLGYRFTLIDAGLPDVLKKGREFSVSIRIRNDGWAPVYNQRPVFLRILEGSNVIADVPLNADPRRWLPEEGIITLIGIARMPSNIEAPSVSLALWLPDFEVVNRSNPDFSIRFANENTWDEIKGHNILINGIDVLDGT